MIIATGTSGARRVDEARFVALALLAALGCGLVMLPVLGLALRVDWGSFLPLLMSESARAALSLSLGTATASTAFALLLGTPLAIMLAVGQGWWQEAGQILRAFVLIPLVLPPVVSGLALLATFGRNGPIGSWLHGLGVDVGFTTAAVVIAQTYVALPFVVMSMEAAVRTVSPVARELVLALGGGRWAVIAKVMLPSVRGALVSAAVLAFARCLGEFGATLTFAGSLQGVTRTLPLEIYLQREVDQSLAIALSFVLVAVAFAVVAVSYALPGLGRRLAGVPAEGGGAR